MSFIAWKNKGHLYSYILIVVNVYWLNKSIDYTKELLKFNIACMRVTEVSCFFFKILFHELYKYLNNDDKKRRL